MKIVTIGQVRTHVKADDEDDAQLTVYANAAESACERLANRAIFKTTAELTAAKTGIPAMMNAAYTAYDAAVLAANEQDDDRVIAMMKGAAQHNLNAATLRADWLMNGMALEDADMKGDDIVAAILMTIGHYYDNRKTVITGQGAAAVELPASASAIMGLHRWIGRNEY